MSLMFLDHRYAEIKHSDCSCKSYNSVLSVSCLLLGVK